MSVAVRGELLRYLTPSMHLQNDFANVTTTIKREAPNLLAARDALRALQRKQACSGGGPIRCSAIVMQRTSTLLVQAVGGRVAHQGRSGRRLDLVVQCRADACEGGARNGGGTGRDGRSLGAGATPPSIKVQTPAATFLLRNHPPSTNLRRRRSARRRARGAASPLRSIRPSCRPSS